MPAQKRRAKPAAGIPWALDESSKQAIKSAVENADPKYVDMLAGKIAGRIAHGRVANQASNQVSNYGGTSLARQTQPEGISSELGGMGLDLISWVHYHPYKLIMLGLGLAGGTFLFIKGVDHLLERK